MEEILHHMKSLKSWELQYFRAPAWCRISSINSIRGILGGLTVAHVTLVGSLLQRLR